MRERSLDPGAAFSKMTHVDDVVADPLPSTGDRARRARGLENRAVVVGRGRIRIEEVEAFRAVRDSGSAAHADDHRCGRRAPPGRVGVECIPAALELLSGSSK